MIDTSAGAEESINQSSENEEGRKSHRFCMFFGGTGQNVNVVARMGPQVEKYAGPNNYQLVPSVLSTDVLRLKGVEDKFRNLAQEIIKQLASDKKVRLIAYSFGSVEMTHVLDQLQQQLGDQFDESLSKIDVLLISPAGFAKQIERIHSLFAGMGMVRKTIELFATYIKSDSPYYAIESAIDSPPEGISTGKLSEYIRQAFPELAPNIPEDQRQWIDFGTFKKHGAATKELTEEGVLKIAYIDRQLLIASQRQDWTEFRRLLMYRARVFSESIKKETNPKGETLRTRMRKLLVPEKPSEKENDQKTEKTGWITAGWLGIPLLLKDMVYSEPQNRLDKLASKGLRIGFVLPEMDQLNLPEEVMYFLKKEDAPVRPTAFILETLTHCAVTLSADILFKLLTSSDS